MIWKGRVRVNVGCEIKSVVRVGDDNSSCPGVISGLGDFREPWNF